MKNIFGHNLGLERCCTPSGFDKWVICSDGLHPSLCWGRAFSTFWDIDYMLFFLLKILKSYRS